MKDFSRILLLFYISLIIVSCGESATEDVQLTESQKREIQNALKGLEVHPDLELKLFAAEPMLVNPTNIDVDERGRVWVTEAFNYRSDLNKGNEVNPEGDRIVILEDTDGNGEADKSTIFYQGTDINAALGIAVLGNQVIVSCSPNVWILTDDDGDDISDRKELLFTGISGEQHDHAVHAFVFGPDGKLYFNFGNAGGQIMDRYGKPIIDLAGNEVNNEGNPYREGMIFRCNLDGSDFEVLAHNFRNNYEVTVDSYGRLWQSDNDDDGNKAVRINYVMKYGNYGYTDEVTGAGWSTKRTGMSDEIPLRHWHLNDPGVVPNLLQTGAGSPTGILVYEGRLLPKVFWDQLIHTDAGPNVVRSYPVETEASGYKASIVNLVKGINDSWFRPADVAVAPDGSLMIADWYDPGVGGHQMGDQSKGRIYRLAPPNHKYENKELVINTDDQALKALSSPNMTTRYYAYQRLMSGGEEVDKALEGMLEDNNPRMVARALWLLSKHSDNPSSYINLATSHDNENIRITGLNMALQIEGYDISPLLENLAEDPSKQVRREVALALRFLENDDKASALWVTLSNSYSLGDRWMLEALGIGADNRKDLFFQSWLDANDRQWNTPEGRDIVWRSKSSSAIPMVTEILKDEEIRFEEKLKFFRLLDFYDEIDADYVLSNVADSKIGEDSEIQTILLNQVSPEFLKGNKQLKGILDSKINMLEDTTLYLDWVNKFSLSNQYSLLEDLMKNNPNSKYGQQAIRTLYNRKGLAYFKNLINGDDVTEVAIALEALRHINGDESWALKKQIAFDQSKDISLRRQAIIILGSGWTEEDKVLEMLMAGEIPEDIKEAAASGLLSAIKGSVRKEALKFFPRKETSPKRPITELVEIEGDKSAGQVVFKKLCQNCHEIEGEGVNFGPSLAEIGAKLSKDGLYTSIMYPNAGISFGYEGFLVNLKDGGKQVGYITSKTSESIDLKNISGNTNTLLRKDIVSIESMESSLMIDGLADAMSETELIDLVTYLEGLK